MGMHRLISYLLHSCTILKKHAHILSVALPQRKAQDKEIFPLFGYFFLLQKK